MQNLNHFKRISASALVAVLLAGCAKKPDEQLTDAQEDARSWAATARMVEGLWAKDELPTPYTKQTLQRASDEVQADLDQARKASSQAASGTSAQAVGKIESMYSEIERLRKSVQ